MITRKILSVFCINGLDLTDGLGLQKLAKHVKLWKIKRPKCLGKKKPFAASQFHHFKGLGTIESNRLLHEHVLACIECQLDSFKMQIVRGGYVNHIQIAGGDKLVVIAIGALEPHT